MEASELQVEISEVSVKPPKACVFPGRKLPFQVQQGGTTTAHPVAKILGNQAIRESVVELRLLKRPLVAKAKETVHPGISPAALSGVRGVLPGLPGGARKLAEGEGRRVLRRPRESSASKME
jgi:hypothetical protein